MMLSVAILTSLSLLSGLGKSKIQRIGYFITIFTIIVLMIDTIIFSVVGNSNFVEKAYAEIFYLMVLEIVLFQFSRPVDLSNRTLIPYYSVPLVLILSVLSMFNFLDAGNFFAIFLSFLIIQIFLNMGPGNWIYTIKKTFIMVTIVTLTFSMQAVDAGLLKTGMLIFLYWFTNDLLPLGLDKDAFKDYSYPLANRVLLFGVLILGPVFKIPHGWLLGVQLFILCMAIPGILLARTSLELWKVFKRTGEVFLILTFISQNEVFDHSLLKIIISFNIYSYLPYISRSLKISEKSKKYFYTLSFLLLSGLFLGSINTFITEVIRVSSLGGIGLNIFYFLGMFWLLNLVFWYEFSGNYQKERKIDHLANPITLSAIIIGVLISIG
ncbi:MAG: hypothetical protein K9K67_02415 [Bacteriovoracaceae bacterium]|nr:hypothetical protein [Bacteriovoracaceae bacterium]